MFECWKFLQYFNLLRIINNLKYIHKILLASTLQQPNFALCSVNFSIQQFLVLSCHFLRFTEESSLHHILHYNILIFILIFLNFLQHFCLWNPTSIFSNRWEKVIPYLKNFYYINSSLFLKIPIIVFYIERFKTTSNELICYFTFVMNFLVHVFFFILNLSFEFPYKSS